MNYTPTEWRDRAVERPRNYRATSNPDGTITLTPEPGTVHEEGTPVNAARMNNIENGLVMLDNARVVVSAEEPPGLKEGQLWLKVV